MGKRSFLQTLQDKKFIADIIMFVGYMLLVIGIIMFLACNDGIFFSTAAMAVIFVIELLVLPAGYLAARKKVADGKKMKYFSAALTAATGVMLLVAILFSLVIDFVQPLALNIVDSVMLIGGSVVLLVAALLQALSKRGNIAIIAAVMMIAIMLTGIIWVQTQGYRDFNADIMENSGFIFENGEKDYATFRIPSLVALDCDVINEKYNYRLENDVLLASAEGRRDSSHDTGRIDIVYKTSLDLGATWSELKVLLSYGDGIVGKFGNPTPVLSSATGELVVPYMTGTEDNGYDYSTRIAKFVINADAELEKISDIDISFDKTDGSGGGTDGVREHTLMVGPGKSVELKSQKYKGRLVVPSSGGGHSFVMYSDDGGNTWVKGDSAGEGNECEVAELADGRLVMVVRENTGCSNFHPEQYQRLSYSNDGGETWYKKTADTVLKSPVCMSSVDTLGDGTLLLSYPDSFHTRVNLTLGISSDNGENWQTASIYNGAAGYSCVAVDSDDNIFLLAEIGKINYNETLFFTKLNIG